MHINPWFRLLEFPVELGIDLVIPGECIGSYRRRLVMGSTWPICVLLVLGGGCVAWELGLESTRRGRGFTRWKAAALAGLRRSVPPFLLLTFLLVPSSSTRIFKAFLCEPIEYSSDGNSTVTRRYLHDSLDVDCDSDEYGAVQSVAVAFVCIWPVGIPLLYALLLWGNRAALRTGVPTPLSRATAFLYAEYEKSAFFWEILEMCRKLTLTGWVLLIGEKFEQARVLVALVVSVTFLALHLSRRPLKRAGDSYLMMTVELALILVYLSVLLVKSCDLSSVSAAQRDHISDEVARAVCAPYGLGDTSSGVFLFFVTFALTMLLSVLLLGSTKLWVHYLTPRPPSLTLPSIANGSNRFSHADGPVIHRSRGTCHGFFLSRGLTRSLPALSSRECCCAGFTRFENGSQARFGSLGCNRYRASSARRVPVLACRYPRTGIATA
mmetsp:Transcript_14795/g.39539  ORF Transcript_14795/g.39539 Transcript_14795/m.39539 type:complete len:438 (+) Transcript_14795:2667-3980(+)